MEKYVLGINPGFGGFNYHDPSACLVRNGHIIFATEEERFTRIKSAPGVPPNNSIRACFKTVPITHNDIAAVAVGYSPEQWQQRLAMETKRVVRTLSPLLENADKRSGLDGLEENYARHLLANSIYNFSDVLYRSALFLDESVAAQRIREKCDFPDNLPIRFIEHHYSHAISAFFPSLFDKSTIIVLDGLGEIETVSAWVGEGKSVKRVYTDHLPNSLGYFYGSVTEFLGFKGWEGEGKTMALAAYGNFNEIYVKPLSRLIDISEEGFDVSKFVEYALGPKLSLDLELAVSSLERLFQVKRRYPSEEITQIHKDIAWAAQNFLERSATALARKAVRLTGCNNLCFAGGVALNCKLNMVLREMTEIDKLYVQPVASDAGVAIGASLAVAKEFDNFTKSKIPHLSLGSKRRDDLDELLSSWKIPYKRYTDVALRTAQAIADKKIVMWFYGRSEVGPRALGARSILGDPRSIEIKIKLNEKVKEREVWRPFGPSILEEYATEVLEDFPQNQTAPYMIQAYKIKENWRKKIPAVIHEADNTTRPHTVSQDHQPLYYEVIKNFYLITGIPLIINTSFNGKGEPLVETPAQAIRHFMSSSADILVVDEVWIEKI